MGTILTFILTFCVVIVVLKLISLPLKIIFKLAINILLGGLVLFVLAKIGITLVLSWWMIVMVAILGIPAVLIILALNFII